MVHNPSNVEKYDEELVSKLLDTSTYSDIKMSLWNREVLMIKFTLLQKRCMLETCIQLE
jgi:hypothetical protein